MNLWGFSKGFLSEIAYGFRDFLQEGLQHNPLKCEYYLPSVVSRLLDSNKAEVKVLLTTEKWYGVTYKEDKPMVMAAVKSWKRMILSKTALRKIRSGCKLLF